MSLAIEAVQYNGQPYIEIEDLWQALHQIFNLVQNCQVNASLLDEIPTKLSSLWSPFSRKEFTSAIDKCSNLSASGPNRISWKHLKIIVKDEECLGNIVNIANMCINLGHWPLHFKSSLSIIIPKLNKAAYDFLKSFYSIVFLNTLGKLIEKVIGEHL